MGLSSLTYGQDGVESALCAILMSKPLSNHTLGQDILPVVAPVVNNFERVEMSSNSLVFSQSGIGLTSVDSGNPFGKTTEAASPLALLTHPAVGFCPGLLPDMNALSPVKCSHPSRSWLANTIRSIMY